MKLKNVKAGQRVQCKGTRFTPELKGALGTIRESGNDTPFVEWDDDVHNCTEHEGYRVNVIHHTLLRKAP